MPLSGFSALHSTVARYVSSMAKVLSGEMWLSIAVMFSELCLILA